MLALFKSKKGGVLQIHDEVQGNNRHRVKGGFLLAPGWKVTPCEEGWDISCGSSRASVKLYSPNKIALSTETRPIHQAYGVEEIGTRIQWEYEGALPLSVKTIIAAE